MLNMRLVRPRLLVDVDRVPARLRGRSTGGPRRRDRAAGRRSPRRPPPRRVLPPRSGSRPVATRAAAPSAARCHADPAAELPALLVALGGDVVAAQQDRQAQDRRRCPVRRPVLDSLRPDELLLDVVPPQQGRPPASPKCPPPRRLRPRGGDRAPPSRAARARWLGATPERAAQAERGDGRRHPSSRRRELVARPRAGRGVHATGRTESRRRRPRPRALEEARGGWLTRAVIVVVDGPRGPESPSRGSCSATSSATTWA